MEPITSKRGLNEARRTLKVIEAMIQDEVNRFTRTRDAHEIAIASLHDQKTHVETEIAAYEQRSTLTADEETP